MSEEIKDAGKTVPRAMVGSYLLNGITGLIFLISYMFMMTDVETALNDATGYPHMWVFTQALSPGGAVALNSIPTLLLFAGTVSLNVSTSRQTWAFARDKGLPFSGWIGQVNKKLQVPVNAVTCTCLITIALSLINIGSDVALNASKLYQLHAPHFIVAK
jgi:amino acid transporter